MSPLLQRPRLVAGVLTLTAAALMPSAAGAVTIADDRVEIPITSSSPQRDVVASVVRLHVPMLPSAAPHPAACDWIAYQRWRLASGPTDPTQADAVAVLQPGVIEGATAFDVVARNTIRAAARRGREIEVWGIDRRANCLEDTTGVDAVDAVTDPSKVDPNVALDYYYRGASINGRTFAGFAPNDRVLADIGLQQTMEDYHSVLLSELPSQPWRERHVICGGHSLGGPLTEIYASWDFDGKLATTEDAGYRQCAGYIGLDTFLAGGSTGVGKIPNQKTLLGALSGGTLTSATALSVDALKAGLVPRSVNLLGISPETMTLLELLAVGADKLPNVEATSVVRSLPRSKAMDDFLKLSGSGELGAWLTGSTSLRDYRYTYRALLGQILDDNGAVYGLVRSSFGYFDGSALRRNRLADQLAPLPGLNALITQGRLMLPQKVSNPALTTWRDYDELGGDAPVGAGVTDPGEEVTDADDLTRLVHEGPLNLTEHYFPIRLILEQGLLSNGSRAGSLRGSIHAKGILSRPRVSVIAKNSILIPGPVDPQVFAPGYQHLDVLTAAERQNNGQPEIASQTFANLIDQALAG